MAVAAGSAIVKSTFFHPQHLLARHHYPDASSTAHPCAACEDAITGAGYTCAECGFHIHEACLLMVPESISLNRHREHPFTLTLVRANRRCAICKETSDAGSCMYRCAPCDLDVHPLCAILLRAGDASGAIQPRRSRTRRVFRIGLKIGMFGFRVADLLTGGLTSPLLDAVDRVIDNL